MIWSPPRDFGRVLLSISLRNPRCARIRIPLHLVASQAWRNKIGVSLFSNLGS